MFRSLIIASALAAAAPAAPALAAGPSIVIELGVHDRGDRYDRGPNISRREAARIAYSYGLTDVRDIELRGGVWEVSGRSNRGGRIEVEISARNGRVIDVDYGRGRGRGRGWDDDDRGRGRY